MIRHTLVFALAIAAAPALAEDDKMTSCTYQGQVVAAIQTARMDRVKQENVQATVTSNATWPEKYNAAIPRMTEFVYQQKRRDLRRVNLGDQFRQQCIDNWDQIQQIMNNIKG